MNYYKFHIGDYLTRTMHLPDAEDLAYRRLLDLYYITEKPLTLDLAALAKRVRLDSEVIEPVLKEFFEPTANGWFNERCENEIKKYQRFVKQNVENAKKSVSVRKKKASKSRPSKGSEPAVNGRSTVGEPMGGITNNQEPIKETPITPFDEFWSVWPTGPRKVSKVVCREKWETRGLNDVAKEILTHVRVMKQTQQWKEGFVPAPLTYINQSRWLDGDPNGDSPNEGVFAGRKVV